MAGITVDQDLDLIKLTLAELGRARWTEIATDIQDHIAFKSLMRQNRVDFGSGDRIDFQVQVKHSGAARNVGLFAADTVNVAHVMQTGTAPWRHNNTHWAISRRETSINSDPARIVNLIRVRRADAMISLAELMEADFWGLPGANNDTTPWGVQHWIVWNATEGFNGGNPAGYSDVAGLSNATYSRWANWTNTYTNITSGDLVAKMRKAATFTRFMSPVDIPNYDSSGGPAYYSTYAVIAGLENIAMSQNDQLGPDVASMDGRVLFRRLPVTWAPYLENKAGNPVYGINWADAKVHFLSGWFLREDRVEQAPFNHTVIHGHVDNSYNLVFRNRRKHFVLAQSDPTA